MNTGEWMQFPFKRQIAVKLERYLNDQLKRWFGTETLTYHDTQFTQTYVLPRPGDVLEDYPTPYSTNSKWISEQRKSRFFTQLENVPSAHFSYQFTLLHVNCVLVYSDSDGMQQRSVYSLTDTMPLPLNMPKITDTPYNPGVRMLLPIVAKGIQQFVARIQETRDAYRLLKSVPNQTLVDSPQVLALSHHLNDRLVEISKATGVPTSSSGSYASARDILVALQRGLVDMRVPL
jgi:hypothetical protein